MWSAFYTLINIIVSNGDVNFLKTLAKLLLGLSSGPLYFIVVLLQLTVLTPVLIRSIQADRGTKFLFLVTPIYFLILYSYCVIYKTQMPFYRTLFFGWFIFYYFGLWIKIKGYEPIFRRNQLSNSISYCLIGLVFSIIEAYGLLSMGFPVGFACSQIKISSFFYAFTVINLLMVIKPHIDNYSKEITWLRFIGDNSFGIYYVHMFWIMISNKIFSSIILLVDIVPLFQLMQLVFTLLFSCISISITKKIIGEEISRRLLGF